jgi:hypothetical protein
MLLLSIEHVVWMECSRVSEPVVLMGSTVAISPVGPRLNNRAIEPVVRRDSIRVIEPAACWGNSGIVEKHKPGTPFQ